MVENHLVNIIERNRALSAYRDKVEHQRNTLGIDEKKACSRGKSDEQTREGCRKGPLPYEDPKKYGAKLSGQMDLIENRVDL